MKIFIGGSPIKNSFEAEFEDILEEIEDMPILNASDSNEAFLGIENEEHHNLSIVKLADNEFGVITSGSEKKGLNFDAVKSIIEDFYRGKFPEWAIDADRNDFPDGIDDILDNNW